MFKIDSSGATIDNKFTEGDPQTAVPATVVSSKWLNAVQGEIVKVVQDMGLVLSDLDDTQLNQAIIEYFKRGGRQTPLIQPLSNNAGPLDVVGFQFDKTKIVSMRAHMTIERKTDTQNVQEVGDLIVTYDSADDIFHISAPSNLDDAGVIFTNVAVDANISKLQYTTNDLTGTTYLGQLTLTSIIETRIS